MENKTVFGSNFLNQIQYSNENSEKQKHKRLKLINKEIKEFLKNSTIHGLKYIGNGSLSYAERFLWLVLVLGVITASSYYTYDLYKKYRSNPNIVSLSSNPVQSEEVPFPAITICNMNAAKKSEAERILRYGNLTDKSFLNGACELESTLISSHAVDNETGKWENVLNFITRVSQPCKDMLKVCRWRLSEVDCNTIFTTVMTDEGLCCTFNSLPLDRILKDTKPSVESTVSSNKFQIYDWNAERGYTEDISFDVLPFRNPGAGAHLGLTLVLDAEVDDYFCSSGNSLGFRLLLHEPLELPKMTDFSFMSPPGNEIRIIFKATVNDATDFLREVDIRKRKCYFNGEKYLKFFWTYSSNNCKMECLSNITLERCGCVPYYLPRNHDTKICGKLQEICTDKIREMMDIKEISSKENAACKCLPSCFHIDYEKTMSYGTLVDTLKIRNNILRNATATYFKTNMAIVQIYYVSSSFTSFTKVEIYNFSDFLGDIGGLVALSLGLSVLSIAEFWYCLSLKMYCSSFRTKRKIEHNPNLRE